MAAHSRTLRILLPVALLCAAVLGGCGGAASREAAHLRRGRAYLADGDFEKARVEFRNALQIAPNDAEARYENGVVDEKLGNPREAAQFYQGAIDVAPAGVRARVGLGRLYVFAGAPKRALATIAPAFAAHPDDAGLLTVRAAAREQRKDTAAALADALRAVTLAPTDENAVAVLAGIYQSAGEPQKAQDLLRDTIAKLPKTVDLRLALVQLYAASGQTDQAEAVLKDLIRIQPDQAANRMRLAQFYVQTKNLDAAEQVLRSGVQDLPADRQMKLDLISFLAAHRSRAAAETTLDQYIAAAPQDFDLRFLLAGLFEQDGDYAKAEADYRQVIAAEDVKPPGLTARNRLAALMMRRNDPADAKKLLAAVLAQDPRDDEALTLRGNIALAEKDPKAAIADYRSVLRDQPNAVGVMRTLARAHLANGDPALAEDTMRSAVEAAPTDAGAQLDLAGLLLELGKPQQAKPVIDKLVAQQPTNMQALDAQFKIATAMHDDRSAKAAADAMVAAQPRQPLGYHYQGLAAEREKRYADAVALFTKALDLAPRAPEPLQGLTRVLVAMHHRGEALARLDAVIAAYPKMAVAASLKGEVLIAAHRAAQAIAPLNLAITRDPTWWRSYHDLALAELAVGDQKAAIAALRAGIAAAARPIVLDTELAQLYVQTGRPQFAEAVYESALQRNPDADVAANNLAMLLVANRKDTNSLDRAQALTARFADSPNPAFLDTYGWVLYRRGDNAAALQALRTAAARRPDSPESQYHLGMAQAGAGDIAAARASIERALAFGRPFDGIEAAKAALQSFARAAPGAAAQPAT